MFSGPVGDEIVFFNERMRPLDHTQCGVARTGILFLLCILDGNDPLLRHCAVQHSTVRSSGAAHEQVNLSQAPDVFLVYFAPRFDH